MSAHTPGPWLPVLSSEPSDRACVVTEKNDTWFAAWVCHIQTAHVETANANAQLIAAAPELLSIVQELQESAAYWSEYDVPLGIVDRINAAIAKATGGNK